MAAQPTPLPVDLVAKSIQASVLSSSVTLVYGATGSGKSTRVPRFVQCALGGRVLCTMPRRLAAVSAALRVASERGCEVGGEEVGSWVGSDKRLSDSTVLTFATAGVLVELIRGVGANLDRYSAIIVDEVHERSVENDLALALLRTLLVAGVGGSKRKASFKLVLMSATFDAGRYEEFFAPLSVKRINIPDALPSDVSVYHRCSVEYLESILKLSDFAAYGAVQSITSPNVHQQSAEMHLPKETHHLIVALCVYSHLNVCKRQGECILVFLPTYKALEQSFHLLRARSAEFDVRALHSAIDLETSQAALSSHVPGMRKVILATNVAESSLTIPGVVCVIDTLRTLRVSWDSLNEREHVGTVWVSKSQADQRKGRAGRTCAGTVFRLLPRTEYEKLPTYERPVVCDSSLREPSLDLACSSSASTCNPYLVFGACLDPPERRRVSAAVDYLCKIDACTQNGPGGRVVKPTFLGNVVSAIPLSLNASLIVLHGGRAAVLNDGVALACVMDKSPLPVVLPFGDSGGTTAALRLFSPTADASHRPSLILANLAAFEFWQRCRRDPQRLARLCTGGVAADAAEEDAWCSLHGLSRAALLQVEETAHAVHAALHKWRPAFTHAIPLPCCARLSQPLHVCCAPPAVAISDDDPLTAPESAPQRCGCPPLQLEKLFDPVSLERLRHVLDVIIERDQNEDALQLPQEAAEPSSASPAEASATGPMACAFFFKRSGCAKGDACAFSHAKEAKPPLCKFFGVPGKPACTKGARCLFLHAGAPDRRTAPPLPDLCSAALLRPEAGAGSELKDFLSATVHAGDCILLLNEAEAGWRNAEELLAMTPAHLVACSTSTAAAAASVIEDADRLSRLLSSSVGGGVDAVFDVDIIALEAESRLPWPQIAIVHWHVGDAYLNTSDEELGKPPEVTASAQLRAHLRAALASFATPMLLADPTGKRLRLLFSVSTEEAAQLGLHSLARDVFMHVVGVWCRGEDEGGTVTFALAAAMPSPAMVDMLRMTRPRRLGLAS